jgi:hypothetical protein
MVRTEVKISMKKKYSACLYFKLLKSYPNVVPFLRNAGNNPSAVMFFQRFIFSTKKNSGKSIRSASGFFIASIPFEKEEEAENSYRMGLWHFTPFLNKRAPN